MFIYLQGRGHLGYSPLGWTIWTSAPEAGATVTAADGILLDDPVRSELLKRLDDFMLLDDAVALTRQRRKEVSDNLLLGSVSAQITFRDFVGDDFLLLSDERIGAVEKQIIQQLLLADALAKIVEKETPDFLLLGDDATADYIQGQQFISRQADDALLLLSRSVRAQEHILAEGVLFADQALKDNLRTLADNLLLLDQRSSVVDRLIEEGLLIVDAISADRIKTVQATDGLLLDDGLRLERILEIADQILLFDEVTIVEIAIVLRQIADQLLFADQRFGERILTAEDKIIFADFFSKARAVDRPDNLLLGDQIEALDRRMTALDGLLLTDDITLELLGLRLRSVADTLLLSDQRISAVLRVLDDELLLDDEAREAAARTRLADDTLLLNDAANLQIIKTALDTLLLFDEVTVQELGVFLRSVSDTLLFGDETTKKTLLTVADRLLLQDTAELVSAAIISRTAADQLLLVDRTSFQKAISILDGLLLTDAITLEQIGVALRSVSDTLLIGDQRRSAREMTVADKALLGDAAEKVRELLTADNLLMIDTVAALIARQVLVEDDMLFIDTFDFVKSLTSLFRDDIMFADFITKASEMTQAERLLLLDDVTTLLIEAEIAALVWAALRARDLLGITITWRNNFLGSKIDDRDYLSTAAGYLRTTDLRVVYVN